MMSRNRLFFSLVELSIVILIISVLTVVSLIARSLISRAVLTGVWNEVSMYRQAFVNFNIHYGCVPGGCLDSYAKNNLPDYRGKDADAKYYNNVLKAQSSIRTGIFEGFRSVYSFWDLSATGFIPPDLVDHEDIADYRKDITDGKFALAGYGLPYVSDMKEFAWAYSSVLKSYDSVSGGATTSVTTLPYEMLKFFDQSVDDKYTYFLVPVVAIPTTTNITELTNRKINFARIIPAFYDNVKSGGQRYGTFSGSFSYKLDTKFDDGKPYSGNIWGGREINDMFGSNSSTQGCTSIGDSAFNENTSIDYRANYNNELSTYKCITAFLIDLKE